MSDISRRTVLATSTLAGAALVAPAAASTHEKQARQRDVLFDQRWKFTLGDPPGAHRSGFDDGHWRVLDLPHDWSIEDRPGAPAESQTWVPPVALWNPNTRAKDLPPVRPDIPIVMAQVPPATPDGPPHRVGPFDAATTNSGWGTGWTVGGIGWYRKAFAATDLAPDDRLEIRFDGAYDLAEVWLNGVSLGRSVNGYQSFAFDLTPHLHRGGLNLLAVRVANEGPNARWYPGSGLYRHVWLTRTGAVRIPLWGVATTTTSASKTSAALTVAVDVENHAASPRRIDCHVTIRDDRGRIVGSAVKSIVLAASRSGRVETQHLVTAPALWSPATPVLHTAEVSLAVDGVESDRYTQRFGIRMLTQSATSGFRINGEQHVLRGACVHHDNGILGAAAIDTAERRKIALLKANGFNAIRTSHNPMSPMFLDTCDELGMIVLAEAFDMWEKEKFAASYNVYFPEHWRTDLAAMIRRDRNHPSIAFWSIGNEIPEASSPHGVELATQMRKVILGLDGSRFITNALVAQFAGKAGEGARAQLDIVGYNYSQDAVMRDHAAYPDLTFITTESMTKDSYDLWEKVARTPAYLGEFVWTGIDYLGEVGCGSSRLKPDKAPAPTAEKRKVLGMDLSAFTFFVWDFPAYQSGCGELDILGQKKPPSYYRDVVWGRSELELFVNRPTPSGTHEDLSPWGWHDELASWTWPAQSSVPMTVRAYCGGDEVALLLNGAPVGRKALAPADKRIAEFQLPYQPGTLTAVAYAKGHEIARRTLATVGAPARLRLRAEQAAIGGTPGDLAYVFAEVCDAQGRLVPDAAVPLTFAVTGRARLRAAGSANPYGIESFQDGRTRSFHGTALVIAQPVGTRGEATITVTSPGLASARQRITVG